MGAELKSGRIRSFNIPLFPSPASRIGRRRASWFIGPGSIRYFWWSDRCVIFGFLQFFFLRHAHSVSHRNNPLLLLVPPLLFVSILPSYRRCLFAASTLLAEAGLCGMGVPPNQSGRNYGKGEPTRDEGSFRSTIVKHNLAITGEEIELSHFPCGIILQTPCFIN